MPAILEPAVEVEAGRDDRRLDRVQHVEAGRHVAEAVPAVLATGLCTPSASVLFSTQSLRAADAFLGQLRPGPQTSNHQSSSPNSSSTLRIARRKSSASSMLSSTSAGAARRFHHRRRHVAAGDDAVLRAGRGVHQVGFVEEMPVELGVLAVLHQDVARLADPGQQLVDRLRGIGHRMLRPVALAAHRMVAAVERMERRVRQPGLVEMQVLDIAVEHPLDRLGVVEHPVIGRLRQRHDPRLDRIRIHTFQQRVGADLGLDRLRSRTPLCGIGPMMP